MPKEPQNSSATYLTQPEKSHSLHGNDSLKMYIDGTPAGKNSGRIFRLSAPGAPTTVPAHTKEQKGFLDTLWPDKECLARIAPCRKNHRTQARHTSAVPKSPSHNTQKTKRNPLPQGKIQDEFLGCRRRARLQPPRTTPKNNKGFLGTLWPNKECLARIAPCQENHQTQARHTSAVPKSTSHNASIIPKNKRAFWARFGPTKSAWRASHHAKRITELKRDIPRRSA